MYSIMYMHVCAYIYIYLVYSIISCYFDIDISLVNRRKGAVIHS